MTVSFLKKRQQRRLLAGIAGSGIYMIVYWLIAATGAGSEKIGTAANAAFRNMAMWRFEAAAWLCVIAISGIYVGAMELVNISREAEVTGNKTSHYMGKMFRVGIMALVVLYLGRALLNCLFPMVYRLVYKSSNDEVLAAQITNGAADRIRLPVVLAILVMDLFPSVVWYYMVLQKRISVPVYGVIYTPLSMMVIGYCIRLIPTQFTADFTAAFEPFGWLLMMYGAYMHTRSRVSSIPQ